MRCFLLSVILVLGAVLPADARRGALRLMTFDLLKLDIDHVMIDSRLSAGEARVLDAGTSDHRPVVVTIAPR
jgi:endonuclease/exonuclease/phosphatase (EEP) superfamily protein YafD